MDPVSVAVLQSWSFEPEPVLLLLLIGFVYLRGFRVLRMQLPAHFPAWRAAAFVAGVASVVVAICSPVDAFADLLLQVHMAQHWLLMMVAPPLIWLGAPSVPLLRGLPRPWLKRAVGPMIAWPMLRRGLDRLTQPGCTWLVWAATTLCWHLPFAYEAALRSRSWHDIEHASFLSAALLFWYPVLSPWPAKARRPRAWLVLYLAAAALFNTVFSASFAFSNRVFYGAYADAPRPWGLDALADQNAAGAFMWIASSVPMIVAAVAVLLPLLDLPRERRLRATPTRPAAASRATSSTTTFDLRGLLRSRAARRTAQWTLLALAGSIVVDGLLGRQEPSALNLAGVLPWTYWRGFVVIALLVLGNVFCAVCPFTLSRSWLRPGRMGVHRWPAWLDHKWLAVALFVLYLWAYELFAIWDSPFWTAWIVVGYFAACFLVDSIFGRGRFCRHVCPIGQFHFVAAGVSPSEVARVDASVCGSCRTHDCLKGNARNPGCPTGLFLPSKQGSLDCTFCLDCVRACPHDNARVVAIDPGARLGARLGAHPRAHPRDHPRSHPGSSHPGQPRSARFDVAAMMLVFTFGAFANAAAMVAPVVAWEDRLGAHLGVESRWLPLTLGCGVALLVAPAAAALACGLASQWLGRSRPPARELAARLVPAWVPIGFAMWLAHFGFHLATGIGTLGPAVARALGELGLAGAGALPDSGMAMADGSLAAWLEGAEIAVLGGGLVVSVAVAWRLCLGLASEPRRAAALAAPWVVVSALLYAVGVWIVLQPMQMRGMVM